MSKTLAGLLLRNLRCTDLKAMLGPNKFAVLLVDTPEMGGRSAIDRIFQLANQHGMSIAVNLRVHDSEGFDPEDDPPEGGQRFEDQPSAEELEFDSSVFVSPHDPLVRQSLLRAAIKRAIDIAGASVGLLVTSPVLLVSMLAIKRYDSGPLLFTQTREGLRGKPFTIYKLRYDAGRR